MDETLAHISSAFLEIGLLTLPLLGALGALGALWSVVKLFSRDDDIRTREEGKKLLVGSGVALFLSVSLWLILDFVARERVSETQSQTPVSIGA